MSDRATESNEAQSSSEEAQKPQIEPIRMPTVEEIRGQDIWNNCAVRSVVSGVMGGGLGLFMGLFLGALDNPIMQEEMTTRQQLVYQAKQMGRRSWSSCKTFAVMGLVFSAAECVVEKARAKHDMTNTAVAGCVTGGTLSARGGQGFEPWKQPLAKMQGKVAYNRPLWFSPSPDLAHSGSLVHRAPFHVIGM
ncbi:mitochondrial import inner membrane translocase subunit TIM22-4 isoform X1 [Nicotiana tabacum]|uniref:Mitochondrial import inner membrane translocase subunit TIM22-4 isoform X1 n=2 Tax=Nicotiana TaxID=4085 RepID=A0A1S3ZWL2_TOBAC|nr:PREDICTED: mitochondrial import inner membrane translocase subunit TIM22-4-like isoform X1 [Nicotiana sylvestris]XP_016468739.1 PREDICTED: mitochondrial import inner membrane translocase subunit TIM22-4-like isoform X1 [Nicotiana tabacum]